MPTYQYQCNSCVDVNFEVIEAISASPLTQCPTCKKDTLERIIFAPAVHFKCMCSTVTKYTPKQEI